MGTTIKVAQLRKIVLSLFIAIFGSSCGTSRHLSQQFEATPGGILTLIANAGSISVSTWKKQSVGIEVRNAGSFTSEQLNLTYEQLPREIIVKSNFRQPRGGPHISFRINVPENYNLNLSTESGAIEIEGDITGSVDLKTGIGHVQFDNVDGDLAVEGNLGRIRGASVLGNLKAHTSGGPIEIGDVKGFASASTSRGEVHLGNVGGDLSVETSLASVQIGDVNGSARANTSGGPIIMGAVREKVEATTSGGGVYLAGSGGGVFARTTGGPIEIGGSGGHVDVSTTGGGIRLGAVDGAIDATASGGAVEAVLLSTRNEYHVNITTSVGDVTVTLPANLGATVSAELVLTSDWASSVYSINTQFPLQIDDTGGGLITANGEINGGGQEIKLRTENGNINIFRTGE